MYICGAVRGSYIVNHSALGCKRVGEGEIGGFDKVGWAMLQ